MPSYANLVHQQSSTTGTGSLTVSTVNGKNSFSNAFGTGTTTDVFDYFISNQSAAEWERGTGHMSNSTTLVRDTVIQNSAGTTSLISFSAGTKDVTNDQPAGSRREVLVAARTYYVLTTGSDSNNGLANTAAGAFLTIQKAVDTVAALDTSIYAVTIQVGAGTYTGGVVLKAPVGGSGGLVLQGDTVTPTNVVISTTSANAIQLSQPCSWTVQGFKVQTTTSGAGVVATAGAFLSLGAMNFGTVAAGYSQIQAFGARISCNSNYAISGGGGIHMQAGDCGQVTQQSLTVTLTGTPAFTTAFAYSSRLGDIASVSMTYSGAATGTRYTSAANAVIDTAGGGANYFPGSVAGSTSTGGQYL